MLFLPWLRRETMTAALRTRNSCGDNLVIAAVAAATANALVKGTTITILSRERNRTIAIFTTNQPIALRTFFRSCFWNLEKLLGHAATTEISMQNATYNFLPQLT